MKIDFISHREGNRSLILIFAGWSTGPGLFHDVAMNGWDVAVAHDYSNLDFNVSDIKDSYSTIYLFAWSLGVKVAECTVPPDFPTAAFAINGTLHPVDDACGIPSQIYDATIENLSPSSLKKFQLRMSPDKETFLRLFHDTPSPEEITNLKNQLIAIRTLVNTPKKLPWRRAFISTGDRIFPPENMRRSWLNENVETILIPGAHYVSFAEIVKSVIPDLTMLSKNFSRAAGSYSCNALAQQDIARKLAAMAAESGMKPEAKVLEIGPGNGLFTRHYEPLLHPAAIDFVDISPLHPDASAPVQRFFQCDAEQWVADTYEEYDCILSASAIQWFVNIPLFLKNCHRILRDGGQLAISSFLPGNLGELNRLRTSPICYHDISQYREWLPPFFRNVRIEAEDITLEFESPRQLLMHLRLTGVAGSGPSFGIRLKPSDISNISTLTYKPIYILAKK